MANEGKALARASDGTITGMTGLTDKQVHFVRSYCQNGGNTLAAARDAGYAKPEFGYELVKLPHIAAAIRATRELEIQTKGAATAWATMLDLMQNPKYTGAVKFQAARWTLEAAGSGLAAHRAALGLPETDKPLSEMTLSELDAFMSAGRQALDALKDQRERTIEGVVVGDARNDARNSNAEDAQVIDSTPRGGARSLPTQDGNPQDAAQEHTE